MDLSQEQKFRFRLRLEQEQAAASQQRGPATRGRGGNLAEEQAAIDRVTGRNAPAAPAAPAAPRWAKGAT